MPEIAEVRTVAKTLRERIKGRKINNINFIYNKIVNEDLNTFKEHIINKTIKDITNFGKYLLFNLGDYTMISNLRMEGKYFIKDKKDKVEKHEHIIFELDNNTTLRYHDTRKFGRMFTCKTEDVFNTPELSKLGVEPNDPRLTGEYVYDRIKKSNKPIKPLLLEQTVINGLGNIYVDEVLYASNINPNKMASKLKLNDCNNIVEASNRIIEMATTCGGTTIRSYTSSLGVYGTYQDHLLVHTKAGTSCSKCGTKIEKTRVGGRGTYFCPKCQK